MRIIICVVIFISLTSCKSNLDSEVSEALDFTGSNRKELEEVLAHYQNDSLKLKAAYFLIKNMPHYFFTDEKGKKTYDSHIITSKYLIENIDDSFEAWRKRAWNKYITFDDFCELILPYRIANEPLEPWRKAYYHKYHHLLDSVYTGNNIEQATRILIGYIRDEGYDYIHDSPKKNLSPLQLLDNEHNTLLGSCYDLSNLIEFASRAVGIPMTTDFYLYSPERLSNEHSWNAFKDTTGNYIACSNYGVMDDSLKRGKVYRKYFGKQVERIKGLYEDTEIPGYLKNQYIKDVTASYFRHNTIDLPVPEQPDKKNIYLSVFNTSGWIPIDVGKAKGGRVVFKDIEPDVIYLLTTRTGNKFTTASYPFYIDSTDRPHYLQPDTSHPISARLIRKYPLGVQYTERMAQQIGTKIEGANRADFKDARLLYTVNTPATGINNLFHPEDTVHSYRYARYSMPPDKRMEIAEIMFYDEKNASQKLPVTIIVAKQQKDGWLNTTRQSVNDNKILTFFWASELGESITFDFSKPVRIKKINLVPRNDDNFVSPGDRYELFYQDGKNGWISLGKQTANDKDITFDNVPANALLWLRDLTKGKEEHVFFMKDGKQIFVESIEK